MRNRIGINSLLRPRDDGLKHNHLGPQKMNPQRKWRGDRIGYNWQVDPNLSAERSTERRRVTVTLPKLKFMEG